MIRLALKSEPHLRLAADRLIPDRLARQSIGEIERLPLAVGKTGGVVGDWFRVSGEDAAEIGFDGDCRKLDRIGAGMSFGRIAVQGNAGAYLGLGMRGGRIEVAGSAGFGAATDLRSGALEIRGDVGDGLGGSLPGERAGMRDGVVIVGGNAGNLAAARLRRGLVVILGAAGAGCGSGMIAGTIVVAGAVGADCGAAMRRGSIIALGGMQGVGPGFADCGVHDLVFLRLLARRLAELGLTSVAPRIGPLRRLVGDAAIGGRGELLLAP